MKPYNEYLDRMVSRYVHLLPKSWLSIGARGESVPRVIFALMCHLIDLHRDMTRLRKLIGKYLGITIERFDIPHSDPLCLADMELDVCHLDFPMYNSGNIHENTRNDGILVHLTMSI
jgi:hypothetical protein